MSSHSAGAIVRWIERCSFCGWVDTAKLDEWAITYLKEQLTKRAQRIAVAVDTEPFSFIQPSSGDLDLREILAQGFAAVAHLASQQALGNRASTGRRETLILKATLAEVERFIRLASE